MAASSSNSLASRLPFLFMAAFFSYATYVQLNDPDKWLWVCLYGVAAVASFAATLGLGSVATLTSVVAAAGAATLLSTRVLNPPGCEMGEKLIDINGHKLSVDVNTEIGRENSGLLIVLGWNLVAAIATGGAALSAPATLTLLAVSGAILASAVLVPAFVMSPEKLKSYPHCSGLGVTPQIPVSSEGIVPPGAGAEAVS